MQPQLDSDTLTALHKSRLTATRYVVAVAVVLAALSFRLLLDATFQHFEPPFLSFFAAITVSAWFGGWRPGLVTVALSALTVTYFFMFPKHSLEIANPSEILRLFEFTCEGVLICVLAGGLHNALRKADDNARRLAGALEESRVTVRELVRAQQAVHASEGRLRRLVDANIIGVVITDPQGRVLQANEAFLRMVGHSHDDLSAGRINWSDMTPREYFDIDQQAVGELHRSGRSTAYEKEFVRRGGGRIPVLVGAASLEQDGHQTIWFALDQTEQKETEHELEQSKQVAEEANRIKSEFLANTSHELRTPMNSIIGMTDLALEEDISEVVRDQLETARRSADMLMRLLNDILDFSRIEAGRVVLDMEPFALDDVLDKAMKNFAVDASEHGLELTYQIEPNVPLQLLGDEVRLRQIVGNLVGNAVKFTAQGEVMVHVAVESQTSDEVALHFEVEDTGIGIPRELQQRIFAPFTQGDASSTRRFGGTGLGLAIATEFVALMGGRMWVESVPGEGSCFHFTARFGRMPEQAPAAVTREAVDSLAGLQVMVVDDNDTNRDILRELLDNRHMRPLPMATAQEALAALKESAAAGRRTPLVIVDALMPDTDGFTLAEQITGPPKLADAVVLMLSAADRLRFAQRCAQLEVSGYLEKPVSQHDLLTAVLEAVQGPQPAVAETSVRRAMAQAEASLRILVAEDTPANQKVVQAVLEKRGHHVELVANGREAIERFREQAFDAVLMDVQMPVLDGLQATASIRASEQSASERVPIVAMTAHAMRSDRERCLAAGMDAYLAKPVDVHKLVELVESLARRSPRTGKFRRKEAKEAAGYRPQAAGAAALEGAIAAPEPDGSALINVQAALQRMGGSMSLFQDTVQFFREDAPQLLAAIEHGLATSDVAHVERAAHSLKGLAANFDAHQARLAALQLEQLAHDGQLGQPAGQAFEQLKEEVQRLLAALEPYRPN